MPKFGGVAAQAAVRWAENTSHSSACCKYMCVQNDDPFYLKNIKFYQNSGQPLFNYPHNAEHATNEQKVWKDVFSYVFLPCSKK